MSDVLLAPLQINDMSLVKMHFTMPTERPKESFNADLEAEFSAGDMVISDEGSRSLVSSLSVDVTMPNDGAVSVTVRGSFSIGSVPYDDAEVMHYLKMNAASLLYSHARSSIMSIMAMSPMGRLIIPAIDPESLVDDPAQAVGSGHGE